VFCQLCHPPCIHTAVSLPTVPPGHACTPQAQQNREFRHAKAPPRSQIDAGSVVSVASQTDVTPGATVWVPTHVSALVLTPAVADTVSPAQTRSPAKRRRSHTDAPLVEEERERGQGMKRQRHHQPQPQKGGAQYDDENHTASTTALLSTDSVSRDRWPMSPVVRTDPPVCDFSNDFGDFGGGGCGCGCYQITTVQIITATSCITSHTSPMCATGAEDTPGSYFRAPVYGRLVFMVAEAGWQRQPCDSLVGA
jgi:hypothetical protein